MPWTPADAVRKTKRANTPARSKKWAAIADAVLRQSGNEGTAIAVASKYLKAHAGKK